MLPLPAWENFNTSFVTVGTRRRRWGRAVGAGDAPLGAWTRRGRAVGAYDAQGTRRRRIQRAGDAHMHNVLVLPLLYEAIITVHTGVVQ